MQEGKRYVFTWNTEKYPDAKELMARFDGAGIKLVANIKPCLLNDHPAFNEVASAGGFVRHASGTPVMAQFWDGEAAQIDFTSRAGVAWWQDGLAKQVLATGIDAGWNDNNEYNLPADDATCDGFGYWCRWSWCGRAGAADDARNDGAAAGRSAGTAGVYRHARGVPGDFSVMRRPGAATTRRDGTICGGICAPACR